MISIMVFMVLAVLVFIHKIYTLFGMTRKQTYTPNLRPLRRSRRKENGCDKKPVASLRCFVCAE